MIDDIRAALSRRDYQQALSLAESPPEGSSDDVELAHLTALALAGLGRVGDANTAIDRALALAPERADLHVTRARLAAIGGDPAVVADALAEAGTLDPNRIEVYLARAMLALSRGEIDEAEKALAPARRIAAGHPYLRLAEGQIAQARGDLAAALKAFAAAAEGAPENAVILQTWGIALLRAGHNDFAVAALKRALAADPHADAIKWALVQACKAAGDFDAAIPVLEALEAEPRTRAAALLQRAALSEARGDPAASTATLAQAVDAAAKRGPALVQAVRIHQQLGRLDAAKALIEAELAREAPVDEAYALDLMLADGDESRLTAAGRWQTAQPGSVPAGVAMAEALERSGDNRAAIAAAQEVLARDPSVRRVEAILARSELKADPAAALARADQALAGELDPGSELSMLQLRAHALDRLGETKAAWQAFAEMHRASGNRPPASVPRLPALDETSEPSESQAPLPAGPLPADVAPVLIWGPPGSRVDRLALLIESPPQRIVLHDRFTPQQRADGFGPGRPESASAPLGSVAAWRQGIAALGVDPRQVVDWLPVDGVPALDRLPGARLIAVIDDPRVMLLRWRAMGGPHRIRADDAASAAAFLAEQLEPLASAIKAERNDVYVVRLGQDDTPDQASLRALDAFIGLERTPQTERAAAILGPQPMVSNLAYGDRIKAYRDIDPAPFALLDELASRLGFARS